jgi:Zn-dependent M28 family amino/carboxypeptidase|tara:strand:+ start:1000 stop:1929 length:930 start_codon:yes stop_codon:yes gene_type:complete
MFKQLTLFLLIFSGILSSQVISEELIKSHLFALSSDLMEGRKAGTIGIEKAAIYIEKEFERIGLGWFGGMNSYRQNFEERGLSLFNIVGYLEGKSKKNEIVVISAHYDHLGIKKGGDEEDVIFNGANDNASGVTAVLALAEHFSNQNNNERSLLFVAFTAEEMGLLGSNYFGKQINAKNIIAGINIEMIGKESPFGPKTAWITGFDRSDFGRIIQQNLIGSDYKVFPDPYVNFNLFFRSDNASLAKLGVPSHTFSTSPMDKDLDYHKVSDEAKTLDLFTISETIKAIAAGVKSIISGADSPTRVSISEN